MVLMIVGKLNIIVSLCEKLVSLHLFNNYREGCIPGKSDELSLPSECSGTWSIRARVPHGCLHEKRNSTGLCSEFYEKKKLVIEKGTKNKGVVGMMT
ncbi:hypothetical protein RUM43_008955 [Polyplax serrata]|uniref:Uncharacterized protein n=1 Tax=Polyplax serrata TaxID=468196 RepID=A0AAN8S1Q0_POLSC